MGLEIMHVVFSLLTICMLLYVLWTDWVSQEVRLNEGEVWAWSGNLREVTSTSLKLDSHMYSKINKISEQAFSSEFYELFDELYKGGATAMTLLIVLLIFSCVWLIFGLYTELKKLWGYAMFYPYFLVLIYHSAMIIIPLLTALLWGAHLHISSTCSTEVEGGDPEVCVEEGALVTFGITIVHCAALISFILLTWCKRTPTPNEPEPAKSELMTLKSREVDILTPSIINANLPSYNYKPKKPKLTLCKLWTFEIKNLELVRLTACSHVFHQACIDQFLMQKTSRGDCFECGRNVFGGKIRVREPETNETEIGRSYSARL